MENISPLNELLQRIDQRKTEVDTLRPLTQVQEGRISKSYAQKLTPEEFTDLSKIFVREALEQIKALTGK